MPSCTSTPPAPPGPCRRSTTRAGCTSTAASRRARCTWRGRAGSRCFPDATAPTRLPWAMEGLRWVRGLSAVGAVALIVGNMVGTSIYTLPASLAAATGPLGMVAWLVTALGYLFVALVYASLGARYPRTGGPYVYARAAFGELAGFQTVWSYWVSAVIGNAAIVTSVVAYASGF